MKQPVQRRLAAVLAADVAGYSRLMGADEEGTLDRLRACRRELVNPKIREHRGRIVKTTGGGMLVVLPSVVDAVRCRRNPAARPADAGGHLPAFHGRTGTGRSAGSRDRCAQQAHTIAGWPDPVSRFA